MIPGISQIPSIHPIQGVLQTPLNPLGQTIPQMRVNQPVQSMPQVSTS